MTAEAQAGWLNLGFTRQQGTKISPSAFGWFWHHQTLPWPHAYALIALPQYILPNRTSLENNATSVNNFLISIPVRQTPVGTWPFLALNAFLGRAQSFSMDQSRSFRWHPWGSLGSLLWGHCAPLKQDLEDSWKSTSFVLSQDQFCYFS